MKLCIGTSKGIVILDSSSAAKPTIIGEPSSVWCLAQDCRDSNLLYAGKAGHGDAAFESVRQLSRSVDGGRTWRDITVSAMNGEEIWALATAPDQPGVLYVGASHGRLFKSTDRGESFIECTAFLKVPGREHWSFPPPPHIPHVRSISFDPRDAAIVYIGVEEGGVFRSRDRCESFEDLNHGIYEDVHTVRVDPLDSNRLYATTGRGFYLSENTGASWSYITDGITRRYTVPLAATAGGHVTVYTAAAAGAPPSWRNGADALLFRSIDRGRSFEAIPHAGVSREPMVMRLIADPRGGGLFGALTDGSIIHVAEPDASVSVVADNLPPAYDMVAIA